MILFRDVWKYVNKPISLHSQLLHLIGKNLIHLSWSIEHIELKRKVVCITSNTFKTW